MEPLFTDLYKHGFSDSLKTRLSNSCTFLMPRKTKSHLQGSGLTFVDLIGEIFGILYFGYVIDKIGRRTGIVFATLFLVLGIVLATAAHGYVSAEAPAFEDEADLAPCSHSLDCSG